MTLSNDEYKSIRVFSIMALLHVVCIWVMLSLFMNFHYFAEKGYFSQEMSTTASIRLMESDFCVNSPAETQCQAVLEDWQALQTSDAFKANLENFEYIQALPLPVKMAMLYPLNVSVHQDQDAAKRQILDPIDTHFLNKKPTEHSTPFGSTGSVFLDIYLDAAKFSIVLFWALSVPFALLVRRSFKQTPPSHSQHPLTDAVFHIALRALVGVSLGLLAFYVFLGSFFW